MKTQLLYLNYHKLDNKDDNISKFIKLLENNFGKNQIASFNSQQIHNCDAYVIIFTKTLLDKLDKSFFFENLQAIKNNQQIVLPIIIKPSSEETEYRDKIDYFINNFKNNNIEYIEVVSLYNLCDILDQIKNILHHNFDNNIGYLDYLKTLRKECLAGPKFNKLDNHDNSIPENKDDYHLKMDITRHPMAFEINDEELNSDIVIKQDDFIDNIFDVVFTDKEKTIELVSNPGSGKTGLIKKTIVNIISKTMNGFDNVIPIYIDIPLFINYLLENKYIEKALCEYLKIAEYALNYLIHHKKAIFFFDGIDYSNNKIRNDLINFIEKYITSNGNYVILSSNDSINKYRIFSLNPLNFEQKETLIDNLIKNKKHNFKIDDLPSNLFEFCLDLTLYQLQNYFKLPNVIYQKPFDTISEVISILNKNHYFYNNNDDNQYLSDNESLALVGKYYYFSEIHKTNKILDFNFLSQISTKFDDLDVFESFKIYFLNFQKLIEYAKEIKDYVVGYYLYYETVKNNKNIYVLLDKLTDNNHISNTHFYPIKMLLLLLDSKKEDRIVSGILNYLQLKVIPNYDMITQTINDFSNEDIKNKAIDHIMNTMLDRGYEGIQSGTIDAKGLYSFENGANPYEELFYYLSKNPNYYPIFSNVNREDNPIKEYLYQEALDIFGIKLEIKFFQYEKYIDLDTSKKLKYAKSIKRKENYLDIRGHIGIFEKNLEGFLPLDSRRITSLYVYPGVEELGNGILFNLENLTNIRCDHRNKRYYSELQCLIERSTRQLIIGCQNSTIPGNVVSIAGKAWWGSRNMKKLTIPFNVLDIGAQAFCQCTSLETISLGSSLKSISEDCFRGCSSLRNINLPNGLKTIGAKAFFGCLQLKNIYIPKSIDNIGPQAFTNCPSLTIFTVDRLNKVYVTDRNFLINKDDLYLTQAFNETYIPNKIRGIESQAFNHSNIKKVILTNDLKQVKANAFYYCKDIEEIFISKSVDDIQPLAFYNSCNSLKTITIDRHNKIYTVVGNAVIDKKERALLLGCSTTIISDIVEVIKEGSLVGIENITEIVIPKKVKSIEDNAICRLINLNKITVDKDNDNYYSSFNTLIEKHRSKLILGCKNSIIPDEVEIIGQNAFSMNFELNSINLPDNLEKIEKYAFYRCYNLKQIIIPDKTYTIQRSAFEGCTSLEELIIPESIRSIEWYAFNHCPGLKKIKYKGTKKQFEEIRIGSHNDVFQDIEIEYEFNK